MATQSYSHIDLAEAQLDCAISLYLNGIFIPVISLAGAAEELYGGPHEKAPEQWRNDPRAHKQDARDFNLVFKHQFGHDHPKPWDVVNAIKNGMKHYRDGPIEFDPEDEAYWAIDRASKNRELECGNHHPRVSEVDAAHRMHRAATERELLADTMKGD